MKYIAIIFLGFTLCFCACTKMTGKPIPIDNKIENNEVTYTNTIKSIIEIKCGNCHTYGYAPHINTYQTLYEYVKNDKLKDRVLIKKDMPSPGSEPLSPNEIANIENWLNKGAKE